MDIRIQLFHSAENRELILGSPLKKEISDGIISLTCLRESHFSEKTYNALLLSEAFWNSLNGRKKILIFQTDTVLCANSEYSLEEFMDFDYIGATWNPRRPVGLVIHGGNGGLSLRDWHVSTDCLRRFPPDLWSGGEDGYFAFHGEIVGGKVGGPDDCEKFATHKRFKRMSFGAHQVQSLGEAELAKFLRYCPEAAFMLER